MQESCPSFDCQEFKLKLSVPSLMVLWLFDDYTSYLAFSPTYAITLRMTPSINRRLAFS
jgi:hypothetical protein